MKIKNTLAVFALAIAAIFGFLIYRSNTGTQESVPEIQPQTTVPITASPEVTKHISLDKMPGDTYGLFINSEDNALNNYTPIIKTTEDGIINSGIYAGFHRVFVSYQGDGPDGPSDYVFATKDYKTFVLGTVLDSKEEYNNVARIYNDDSYDFFNKAKVVGLGYFPINHPLQIKVNNFVLIRQGTVSEKLPDDLIPLTSEQPDLKYFYEKFKFTYDPDKNTKSLFDSYILSDNTIYVEDTSGFYFRYFLDDKYSQTDLAQAKIYKSYSAFIPGGCGDLGMTYVLKNISEDDLIKITSTKDSSLDFYTLKDKNSLLNKAEYEDKITSQSDYFKDLNKVSPPDFSEYVAKNPILIFKDPWGRFVALGETQYILEGGCGKPVIYLYPPKPTNVSINFINPISFNTDIPTYQNGWKVLADPDGILKDLQPQATDCDNIDYSIDGSEYARAACKENKYPYLYWSGKASGRYPTASGGWVVSSADLNTFLSSKLLEIGLNDKEMSDMVDFWVPEMQRKNAPYYRISFLDTTQMNSFIPMNVVPRPDTTFRIFLDWAPLNSKPLIPLNPQVFSKLERKGFTLIEWGGLKQ